MDALIRDTLFSTIEDVLEICPDFVQTKRATGVSDNVQQIRADSMIKFVLKTIARKVHYSLFLSESQTSELDLSHRLTLLLINSLELACLVPRRRRAHVQDFCL